MASCCRKVQQTPNDSFVGSPAIRIPTDNINKSKDIQITRPVIVRFAVSRLD